MSICSIGLGGAAQIAQAVFGIEGVGGRVAARVFDNAPHHGIHFRGMPLDEVADGGVALGDPRSGVEQLGGGTERGEIDFDFAAADRRQFRHGFVKQNGRAFIPEELELFGRGYAELEGAGKSHGARWRTSSP